MEKLDAFARIRALTIELNRLTELYDKGTPEVSDKEWDDMYFELQALENEWEYSLLDSPTQRVNYAVVNELKKVKHNHPMLSLDKTKDWNAFINYFMHKDVVGMVKLDGLTCSLRYLHGKLVSAETRGNGEEGEDVLHNALVVKNIPKKINYTNELIVDGEIICTKQDFEEFKNEYANPRNFAAGSIRLLDSKECARRNLKFVLWNVVKGPYNNVIDNFVKMQNLNFTVTPWTSSFDLDAKKFLIEEAKLAGYPIDGLVGRFNDVSFGESLGITGHHSRSAYAFKFYDELYETKLLNIEWSLGKTGSLTPTAVFTTVQIDGCDISKASLHNISIIKKLGLTNNCTVKISKRNEIIPKVEECLQDGDSAIEIPKCCPVCGGETEVVTENTSEVLMCKNPNCSGKLLGRLKFFVSKPAMNIDGLSETTLEKFIELGWITKFVDIYYLNVNKADMIKLDGFGEKSVNKLLESIEKSKNVKLENFICALSIDGVGKSASKTISEAFNGNFEQLLSAFRNGFNWSKLEDIGDKTAANITNYFAENEKQIVELASEMMFIRQIITGSATNLLSGLKFCITGSFPQSRDILKDKLEAKGAKFVSSVSKNLDVLFCGDNAGSKLTKAKTLGVKIMNYDELIKLLED